WLSNTYNANHWNLYMHHCRNSVIEGNYIDQGRIYCGMDQNDGPYNFGIVGNKFTVLGAMSASWAAGNTGWIVLAAPNDTGNDAKLRTINITGNFFLASAGATLTNFPAIGMQNASKFDLNDVKQVNISGNT